jgi:hypothetical protein
MERPEGQGNDGQWNNLANASSHSFAKLSSDTLCPPFGGLSGDGEGQIPDFPSKNALSENWRKSLHRNGQRGYSGIPPEY